MATATATVKPNYEPPEESLPRRKQIAEYVANQVGALMSRIDVRFLYNKENVSVYRVHVRGDKWQELRSHFVKVVNPAVATRDRSAVIAFMLDVEPDVLSVDPPFSSLV